MNEREELYSKINADIRAQKPRMAICYDLIKRFLQMICKHSPLFRPSELTRTNFGVHPTSLQKII